MTELERTLENFLIDIEKEAYEVGAGLKDEANFSGVYARYPDLFTVENADATHRDIPISSGRDTVEAFIRVNIIDEAIKEPTDELMTRELSATIDVAGKAVPFRQAQVLISNEPNGAARRDIDTARLAVQRELNPLYLKLQKTSHAKVAEMGYHSYLDFFQNIEHLFLNDLKQHTEKLLRSTEAVYTKLLNSYREQMLDVRADELAQCDMVYMRRAAEYDRHFAADAMVPAAWKTLAAMGVDAENNPNIHLDIERRDKKSPRAFCAPVRVPDEVYLVIMPHGGADDYTAFYHELGHTLHFAYAAADLPMGARFLGDNSVTEAHAMTIEYLAYCGPWLAWALDQKDTGDYLRYMDFFELYMLRRYSAKLHYEMELHGAKHRLTECAQIYARTLTEATHVAYSPDDYLRDVDAHFYCARYLRAWMLRRQIVVAMERDFGQEWFASPEAGKVLLDLWGLGQAENAEQISARLGFDELNMDAIINHYLETYD